MSVSKEELKELLFDKLAMENMSLDDLNISYPATSFPEEIDNLCILNIPGHFSRVNWHELPNINRILESLVSTELEIAVTPYGNADSPVDEYFAKPHIIFKPLEWLLKKIEEGPSKYHYYYQSQDNNLQQLEHCPIPKFLNLPLKHLGEQQAANIWIGTQGTTSRLHSDNYDNIYIQVSGVKRIYLMPPGSFIDINEKMLKPATYDENMNLVPDPDDPSVENELKNILFPTYNPSGMQKRGSMWIVDLQPGDILFLPALWYHQVEITDPGVNISLNYWHTAYDDERRWAAWNFTRQIARKVFN